MTSRLEGRRNFNEYFTHITGFGGKNSSEVNLTSRYWIFHFKDWFRLWEHELVLEVGQNGPYLSTFHMFAGES